MHNRYQREGWGRVTDEVAVLKNVSSSFATSKSMA